jgi:hypothetical protein
VKRIDELSWRLAQECRTTVQACLREEEWEDAEREFFLRIQNGIQSLVGVNETQEVFE